MGQKKNKVEERGLEHRGDKDRKKEKKVEKGKKGQTHQDRIQPGKIEKAKGEKEEAAANIQGVLEDKKKRKKKAEERGLEDRGDEDRKKEKKVEKDRNEKSIQEARGGASSSAGPYPSETFKVSQKVKLEHMVSFDEGQPRAGLSEAEAKHKAKQRNGKWHEEAKEEDEEKKARKEARKDETAAEHPRRLGRQDKEEEEG